MQPNFAIHFSEEQAQIVQLSGGDRARIIGEIRTAPDTAPSNSPEAVVLRQRMARLGGWSVCSKLVIPNTFIWYTTCLIDSRTEIEIDGEVREHLRSTTPFSINELSFDWYADEDRARIAYVLKQNLVEAEEFAIERQFNPVYFEAQPPSNSVYQRPAFFGLTGYAVRCGYSESTFRNELAPDANPGQIVAGSADGGRRPQRASREATGFVMAAPVLAFLLGLCAPATDLLAIDDLSLQEGSASATLRLAQAAPITELDRRPARRPLDEVNSPLGPLIGSVDGNPQNPVLADGATGKQFPGDGKRIPETAENQIRVLVDRGFDPYNLENDVLERYRLGLQDTTQADVIARIRQTVVIIDSFDDSDLSEATDEATDVAELAPEEGFQFSTSTSAAIENELIAILTWNPLSEQLQQPRPATPDQLASLFSEDAVQGPELPAGTDDLAAAVPETSGDPDTTVGFEIPFSQPLRRSASIGVRQDQDQQLRLPGPAAPDPLATTEISDESQSAELPGTTDGTAARVAGGTTGPDESGRFEIPFSQPLRRGASETGTPEPAPQPETRTARIDPQAEVPAPADSNTRSYVVSQANENIAIDDSDVSLIGIYGPRSSRRALVRLESGSFESLYVGAEFQGGRVVEISSNAVIYEVDNRRYQLNLP